MRKRASLTNLAFVVPQIGTIFLRSVLTLRNRTLLRIEVPAIRPSCERSVQSNLAFVVPQIGTIFLRSVLTLRKQKNK